MLASIPQAEDRKDLVSQGELDAIRYFEATSHLK